MGRTLKKLGEIVASERWLAGSAIAVVAAGAGGMTLGITFSPDFRGKDPAAATTPDTRTRPPIKATRPTQQPVNQQGNPPKIIPIKGQGEIVRGATIFDEKGRQCGVVREQGLPIPASAIIGAKSVDIGGELKDGPLLGPIMVGESERIRKVPSRTCPRGIYVALNQIVGYDKA